MRDQNRRFFAETLEKKGPFKRVLDVGSLASPGGTLKEIVPKGTKYVGLDMRDGDNVDVVLNAHDIDKRWKKPAFDLVVCFDTLEHDDNPLKTVEQIKKVLKPDGWLLISAPGVHCPDHKHPKDYWRFMGDSFEMFFEGYNKVKIEPDYDNEGNDMPDEWKGIGQKP